MTAIAVPPDDGYTTLYHLRISRKGELFDQGNTTSHRIF